VFYVMAIHRDEVEPKGFEGAYAWTRARCVSITNFGDGAAQHVEFRDWANKDQHKGVDHLNWKMAVDNPPAVAQFKPSQEGDYWLVFYPEANFDRNAAIAAAHRG
jgi:hypothetical protein